MTVLSKTRSLRSAYTLVELLVVIAIIGLLVGLIAVFMPGFESQTRSAAGAAELQNWFFIAKQRALMDRTLVGVRLFQNRDDNGKLEPFIRRGQFIEQPQDFHGGKVLTDPSDITNKKILLAGADVTGGQDPKNPSLWAIQPGDYFQVHGSGLLDRIVKVTPQTQSSAVLELATGLRQAVTLPTENYRVLLQPRPLGEEILELPHKIAIDLQPNGIYRKSLPLAGEKIDIMFSPSGAVVGNFTLDRMIFWVRNASDQSDIFFGEPSLIVVYTRSGMVAAYDLPQKDLNNPKNYNPFKNVK